MGIHGINIFGQGIQIFLNTFSLILGCQETVLLHKKASFPFIWRLLYDTVLESLGQVLSNPAYIGLISGAILTPHQ